MSALSGDNPTTLQKHYWRFMNDDDMDRQEVERVFGATQQNRHLIATLKQPLNS
tara:strand:- start:154 stop:315 length:162 start_codon:yes stop_codon:yes gene_type:complete